MVHNMTFLIKRQCKVPNRNRCLKKINPPFIICCNFMSFSLTHASHMDFSIFHYIIFTVIISFKIETSLQELKIKHDCTVIGYRVQLKNKSQANHRPKQPEKPTNATASERDQINTIHESHKIDLTFLLFSQQPNSAH